MRLALVGEGATIVAAGRTLANCDDTVAELTLLCSDERSCVTGQTLIVDGGQAFLR